MLSAAVAALIGATAYYGSASEQSLTNLADEKKDAKKEAKGEGADCDYAKADSGCDKGFRCLKDATSDNKDLAKMAKAGAKHCIKEADCGKETVASKEDAAGSGGIVK